MLPSSQLPLAVKCEMQLSTINFDQNANFANMHTVLFREKSVKLLYP